ncbi:tetratricopeptide repeat protein [Flavobacteriaceae bacterium XHP0103]|uniref:tetratricopeptide repeat protein n=1 Tax=Marixanthotalea marina TaxID=2844359 RepID=UPI002989CC40|nr:tetratricopeptide repeat protein [Marixanthotalea marina]MBU3820692.1 tetratricopeptide repeat protein [Marixanthotalea marina]
MNHKIYILLFLCGMCFFPQISYAQVDFNNKPTDDLGNVEDEFQESFFEALKQKAIENYDRSIEALLKCKELDNSVSVVYFELGKNYNELKDFGAAEDAFKEAVKKDPDNEWYLDALYEFYVQQNDHDNAIKTVKQLVEHHPDYKEDLAGLYFRTEHFDEALKILDELDAEFGISVSRDVLRNRIYAVTGRKEDQIKNLENRIENNPDKESNYIALIFRYSENNEKEKAFETAKELLEINPNSQVVHLALYKFYLDENDAEKAIESMKIVVSSSEISPNAKLRVLSDFVNFVKEHPEYEADLVEATALVGDKNDEETLLELGQYYLSKNDKENALKYFEEALKLKPDDFGLLKNVLLLYLDSQQYDMAVKNSAEAIGKYPTQPIFYLINGVALNEMSQPQKAADILEAGLDWIIDDVKMETDFYSQLSKAYTLLNNTEKAKTFSDKAKQLENKI